MTVKSNTLLHVVQELPGGLTHFPGSLGVPVKSESPLHIINE